MSKLGLVVLSLTRISFHSQVTSRANTLCYQL